MNPSTTNRAVLSPSPGEWEALIGAIEHNNCVLFLGPHFAKVTYDNQIMSMQEAFSVFLATEYVNAGQIAGPILEPSDLAHVSQLLLRAMGPYEYLKFIGDKSAGFFNQLFASGIPKVYESLMQIPFSVIVNTFPDGLLEAAHGYSGDDDEVPDKFWYFNYRRPGDSDPSTEQLKKITEFTSQQRLLVGLFGNPKVPLSFVFTERQRLRFIEVLLQRESKASIPPDVAFHFVSTNKVDGRGKDAVDIEDPEEQIDEPKYLIFLGFNFTDWQLRILLHWIYRNKNQFTSYASYNDTDSVDHINKFFLEKNRRFHFNELSNEDFLDELKSRILSRQAARFANAKKVFVMHVPKDKGDFDMLYANLPPGAQAKMIDSEFFGERKDAVEKRVEDADIVVCFISVDFLRAIANPVDPFAVGVQKARKLHEQRAKKLVLIYVRHCLFDKNPSFHRSLMVLPSRNKPVHQYRKSLDESWMDVARKLENLMYQD